MSYSYVFNVFNSFLMRCKGIGSLKSPYSLFLMELALVNNAIWGWSAAYNAIEKVLLQRGMLQRVYRDKDLVVQANKQRTEIIRCIDT